MEDKEIWRSADGSDRVMVTESGSIGIGYNGEMFIKPIEQWHALASATLRAALVPPADDEVEAIRARHEAADRKEHPSEDTLWQAHADRATLLRALDAERARRVEVEGALKPFAALSLMLPNWTEGTPINVTVYHVGAPTTVKGAIRIRDLRRAATITKETP